MSPYHLLNGPIGQHGCNMSRLVRCLRLPGGAEQCECIFEVSPDLVWFCIIGYTRSTKHIRVVIDERTFGLNLRRGP